MKGQSEMASVVLISLFVIGLFAVFSSVVTIDAGERAVVTRFGKPTGVIFGEGLNWKTPFIEKAVKYDVRTRKISGEVEAGSIDLQVIYSKISVNYRVDSKKLIDLLQNIGDEEDYINKILVPSMQESIKISTTKFKAEEMITKRLELRQEIKESLTKKVDLISRGTIIVIDVNVENIDYSAPYNQAIENKQLQEQYAQEELYKLEKIEIQAQQRIVDAEANKQVVILQAEAEAETILLEATSEAESLRIKNEAIADSKDILELKKIEKWSGNYPDFLIIGETGSNDFLINIGGFEE